MFNSFVRIAFILGLSLSLFSCDSEIELPADVPREAAPETLRQISSGQLIGFRDEENTFAWLGIPFASAPEDDLRWRAPRAPQPWQGVRESLSFRAFCPQLGGIGVNSPKQDVDKLVGSEDCLFLNVWAPQSIVEKKQAELLPVMLWIHGGGNSVGTANTYDFARVLSGRQDVIVVTINYRLGLMGWFNHAALANNGVGNSSEFSELDQSGNFGTLDIIQSLKWVNKNIAVFGGDPNNVTIFGESAGGINVYSLLLSPVAKGLFHKAISQSGGIDTVSVTEGENYRDELPAGHVRSAKEITLTLAMAENKFTEREEAKAFLAKKTDAEVALWLRSLSLETLFTVFDDQKTVMGMVNVPKIFRDGYVIPVEDTKTAFQKTSLFNRVPLITGTNRDEMKTFMMMDPVYVKKWFGLIPSIRDKQQYEGMAYYNSAIWRIVGADLPASALTNDEEFPPVFTYRFDFDQLKDNWFLSLSDLIGAGHGFEMTYAFGLEESASKTFDVHVDETLKYRQSLAFAMSSYWANFAYTGSPSKGRNGDLPLWQAWSNDIGEPKTLLLDAENKGGIRQINEPMTISSLKLEMLSDPWLKNNQALLCETYSQVFTRGLFGDSFFDQDEYSHFGEEGCNNYPIKKACSNLPGGCDN